MLPERNIVRIYVKSELKSIDTIEKLRDSDGLVERSMSNISAKIAEIESQQKALMSEYDEKQRVLAEQKQIRQVLGRQLYYFLTCCRCMSCMPSTIQYD